MPASFSRNATIPLNVPGSDSLPASARKYRVDSGRFYLESRAVRLAVIPKGHQGFFTDWNDAVFPSIAVIDSDKARPEVYVSPVEIRRFLRPQAATVDGFKHSLVPDREESSFAPSVAATVEALLHDPKSLQGGKR
jgi:hypothetical protein